MWGFAQLTKNLVNQASRASCNLNKKANYTPIQKIWANMQTTSLQSRALNLPSLSTLTIFNLREILEKASEQGELPSTSIGASYLVQGTILEGTNVCSIIKKLNRLSINRIQPSLVN